MASEPQMHAEYKEMLSLFAKHRVRYLVVGAYAVMRYTEPRYTKDLDPWVDAAPNNAQRVFRALVEFGAPLKGFQPSDFTTPHAVFQIGMTPIRIDVMLHVEGVKFSTAWRNRKTTRIGRQTVHFISKADLIKCKRKAGRPQDLIDVDHLTGKS
jgi:hypothetical protein